MSSKSRRAAALVSFPDDRSDPRVSRTPPRARPRWPRAIRLGGGGTCWPRWRSSARARRRSRWACVTARTPRTRSGCARWSAPRRGDHPPRAPPRNRARPRSRRADAPSHASSTRPRAPRATTRPRAPRATRVVQRLARRRRARRSRGSRRGGLPGAAGKTRRGTRGGRRRGRARAATKESARSTRRWGRRTIERRHPRRRTERPPMNPLPARRRTASAPRAPRVRRARRASARTPRRAGTGTGTGTARGRPGNVPRAIRVPCVSHCLRARPIPRATRGDAREEAGGCRDGRARRAYVFGNGAAYFLETSRDSLRRARLTLSPS